MKKIMAKKLTAFQEFFNTPVNFDSGVYVVNAEGLWSEDSIVNKFMEEFKDWHWITGEKVSYLKNLIRTTQKFAWVKWHGGINDDGEPQNMWWLYYEFPLGKKGYKPVYVFSWDKHFIENGHKFQPQISETGMSLWSRECSICTKLASK